LGPAGSGSGSGATRSAVLGYGQGGPGGGGNPAAAQRHYLDLIRAQILAQRKYPYMARQRRQEGEVRLRFTLSSAGALSQGVQVVKPSGFNLLDEQARQCVLAAAPFPPFPLNLQRERLSVELPIIYKISELER
jgi:protein TonB